MTSISSEAPGTRLGSPLGSAAMAVIGIIEIRQNPAVEMPAARARARAARRPAGRRLSIIHLVLKLRRGAIATRSLAQSVNRWQRQARGGALARKARAEARAITTPGVGFGPVATAGGGAAMTSTGAALR